MIRSNTLLAVTVGVGVLSQAAVPVPQRLGYTAHHLTEDDLKQIALLASGRPWLIVAHAVSGLAPEPRWYVEVYLEPSHISSSLRRGSVEAFVADLLVRSSRDLNRPFRVTGAFEDDELASLVAFVRDSPADPSQRPDAHHMVKAIKGDWPIVAVTQEPRRPVEVALIDDDPREMSGQKAFLRNISGRWTIERLGGWVAD